MIHILKMIIRAQPRFGVNPNGVFSSQMYSMRSQGLKYSTSPRPRLMLSVRGTPQPDEDKGRACRFSHQRCFSWHWNVFHSGGLFKGKCLSQKQESAPNNMVALQLPAVLLLESLSTACSQISLGLYYQ